MLLLLIICYENLLCGLSMKIDMRETPYGAWSINAFCLCFLRVCGRQKPEYPQLELQGW